MRRIALGAVFSAIDIDQIAHGLECIKGKSQRNQKTHLRQTARKMKILKEAVHIGGNEIAVLEDDQDPEIDQKYQHQDPFLFLLSGCLKLFFLLAGKLRRVFSLCLELFVHLSLHIVHQDSTRICRHDRDQYIDAGLQTASDDIIPGAGDQQNDPLKPDGHDIVDSE